MNGKYNREVEVQKLAQILREIAGGGISAYRASLVIRELARFGILWHPGPIGYTAYYYMIDEKGKMTRLCYEIPRVFEWVATGAELEAFIAELPALLEAMGEAKRSKLMAAIEKIVA